MVEISYYSYMFLINYKTSCNLKFQDFVGTFSTENSQKLRGRLIFRYSL